MSTMTKDFAAAHALGSPNRKRVVTFSNYMNKNLNQQRGGAITRRESLVNHQMDDNDEAAGRASRDDMAGRHGTTSSRLEGRNKSTSQVLRSSKTIPDLRQYANNDGGRMTQPTSPKRRPSPAVEK